MQHMVLILLSINTFQFRVVGAATVHLVHAVVGLLFVVTLGLFITYWYRLVPLPLGQ